jgi:hypothetical protein
VSTGAVDVVLLHGAWCGPWCWTEVIRGLAQRGLTAVAPHLPSRDPRARLSDYVEAACASFSRSDRPLVVGHSLAGILLEPLAAVRRIRRLVYLAAFVPRRGMTLRQQWQAHREMLVPGWNRGLSVHADGTSRWVDRRAAAEVLFNDCSASVAQRAAARLRPQAWGLSDEAFTLDHVSPRIYVSPLGDRLIDSAWQLEAARSLLATEGLVIPGGHSPMVSRPGELARTIAQAGS